MGDIKYIKLSELTQKVEETIKQTFGTETYWIVAEISNHKFYANQERHYFEFIEKREGSTDPVVRIRGVSWRQSSQTIKIFEITTGQKFTDGILVLVKVRLEFHQAYGLSLVLLDIDPSFTLGNLERQRRETLLRLVAENPDSIQKEGEDFITRNKKIRLSAVIQNLALIGSPNSEGYADFIHTMSSNQYDYKFSIDTYPSSVQGTASENELINKLNTIFKSGKNYDFVVIIRGGGSKTDFLVFDTYELSRVAAKFPIPIITGIGHHRDISILDLMVNTSMKTPTKAAEFIISHNRSFEESILILQKSIIIKSQQLVAHEMQDINSSRAVILNRTKTILYNRQTNLVSLLNQLSAIPKIIMSGKLTELANIATGIRSSSRQLLNRQDSFITHYISVVTLMNPVNLLKKGFAIILKKDKILKDGELVSPGNELTIAMHDYTIRTNVISKTETDATKSNI